MIETDALIAAIANETRRQILIALAEAGPARPIDVATLCSRLDVDDDSSTMIRMHHVHLPLLDDLAVVRWDRTANEVEPGPRLRELGPLLSHSSAHLARL
ncbi:hypothetical protein [Natronobeatus ordinarius]|uniref:hypothetical protein n=1 Tax=Natronobeatus ordinarius TaxID=2963433 RepID=UPI0020CFC18F|nr:hypothetical protein [Natronobeatus ordinarius]